MSSLTNLPNRDPFRNYLPNRVPFQSICKGGLFCYGCRQKQWRDHDAAITTGEKGGDVECAASTTDEKGSDVAVRWVCLQHHRREAFHVRSMQKPPTAMARHVPTWNVSHHCILRDLLPCNAAIASCETLASRPDLFVSHLHAG